jgi:hypothetical protein
VGSLDLKRFLEAVKPIEDALFPDGGGAIHQHLLQKKEEK